MNSLILQRAKKAKIMKKIYVLLGLILIGFSSKSQEVPPFKFGLKASPNVGWIKPDTKGILGNGGKLGFNYGLMAEFTLGNSYNYAFATGIDISTYGGKIQYPDVVAPIDTTLVNTTNSSEFTYRYVDIPLTIKMKTNEIGYNTYFAQFGFSTGFRVRGRQNTSYLLPTGNLNEENIDVLKDIAPFRIGLVIGGGVEYNFHGKTALVAGLTFNNGFTNIFNKNYYELNPTGEVNITSNNKVIDTITQKASSNFISLDIGILF